MDVAHDKTGFPMCYRNRLLSMDKREDSTVIESSQFVDKGVLK